MLFFESKISILLNILAELEESSGRMLQLVGYIAENLEYRVNRKIGSCLYRKKDRYMAKKMLKQIKRYTNK